MKVQTDIAFFEAVNAYILKEIQLLNLWNGLGTHVDQSSNIPNMKRFTNTHGFAVIQLAFC